MALLTATQIIDQAMQAGGNTSIQAWSLIELNRILREIYRRYEWPFLMVPDETLTTTASQAYTNYSGLSSTLWKVRIMQIRDGTTLYDVTPLKGGFPAYYGDTSRLAASGRPSKYVLDRKNSRFYWADSIPDAAETISLLYQIDESDVALAGTPTLLTHTKNGEQYLYYRLLQSIKLYMGELAEAAAMATLVREKENAMVGERFDEDDLTPQEWGNARYV